MQSTLLTLISLLALTSAQGASNIPPCAAKCVSLPTQCAPQDIGCICGDKDFITNISCCVSKSCSKDDQGAALQFAQQICQAGGITLEVTAATCIGSSTSSPSTTAAAASGTSTNAAAGATTTPTSAMTMTTGSAASAASSLSSATSSASTSAASAASAVTSRAAAPKVTAVAAAAAGCVGAAFAAVALL